MIPYVTPALLHCRYIVQQCANKLCIYRHTFLNLHAAATSIGNQQGMPARLLRKGTAVPVTSTRDKQHIHLAPAVRYHCLHCPPTAHIAQPLAVVKHKASCCTTSLPVLLTNSTYCPTTASGEAQSILLMAINVYTDTNSCILKDMPRGHARLNALANTRKQDTKKKPAAKVQHLAPPGG